MSSRDQRVGDLFAGTVVIRERAGEAPTFAKTFSHRISDAAFAGYRKNRVSGECQSLSEDEIEVVESFLDGVGI